MLHSLFVIALTAAASHSVAAASTPKRPDCSTLSEFVDRDSLKLGPLTTEHHNAGDYDLSGTTNSVPFCEVSTFISYGINSTLRFSLWLPDADSYSQRYMAVGNGGQAGVIEYASMLTELNNNLGFAVGGSDTGHRAEDNEVGSGPGAGAPGQYQEFLHNEDEVKAWLHDGIALFTPAARKIIAAYYGEEPEYSYYSGCSTGGAQGFSLAEFHPGLFDGVIAGCSGNWYTHLMLAFLWNAQHTAKITLPQTALDLIQASVLDKCDLNDGVQDRLVENPLDCDFDITSIACSSDDKADNTTCLSSDQVATAQALYRGPVRSDSKASIFPGLPLGSEGGWTLPQVIGALTEFFTVPVLQNTVFDLSWDPDTFNWASDVDLVDEKLSHLIDAIETDLSDFRDQGGKLLVYAGWADGNISPLWSLQHVEAITKATLGKETTVAENDFLKLVMIPGSGHCTADLDTYDYIPDQHGFSAALVDWVENDREPVEGIQSWGPRNGDDRTRRLCAWPQTAKLKKGGDIDDWESYTCG